MRYGIAVIIIIIFAIIAIVTLSRGNSSSSKPPVARITKLADYSDNTSASVSWTQTGRLVGEDQHRSIRITVTSHARTAEILDGYGNVTERNQDFSNSKESFQYFTRALDRASFGKERTVKQADERGVCPLGNTYIYRLTEGSREIMRTWSDSCLPADGPSAGSPTLIGQLFKNQITNYNKFVSGVQL